MTDTPLPALAPAWDHWRSFLAVVRHGSLSQAARALGLTQPTLGRQIAALEAAAGATLFARSPRGLTATPLAQVLLPHAEAMAQAAEALARGASGDADAVAGHVRIAASDVIGCEVLPPILADLRDRHPALVIELVLSNRNTDLLAHEADIAVRMMPFTQSDVIARRLGPCGIGLYAHRRYAEAHGLPDHADGLTAHALIGFDRDTTLWRTFAAGMPGLDLARLAPALRWRSDADLAQLALLRAGAGIGATLVPLAAGDPELIAVLPGLMPRGFDMTIGYHRNLRRLRRVRVTVEALAVALRRWLARAAPSTSPSGAGMATSS